MEHRELPRIAPGEHPFDGEPQQAGGRFRLRRFDEAGKNRKTGYRRVGVLGVVCVALVAGLLYLTDWVRRGSVEWLAHQSQYQLPFNQIELVPETPQWYQGGTRAFLEMVRLGAGEPENIPILGVPPGHLAVAFKKYAWVEEVKVAYGTGRIRVDVRYRKPVAWVQLRGGEQKIVDRNGIILPAEDVDVAKLGQMITITGDGGLAAPSDARPGVIWKSPGDGPGLSRVDERIVAASKLAAFVAQQPQSNDAQQSPALHLREIIVTVFHLRGRGLFVVNAERAMISWGEAPGDETTGEPTAEEKWAILRHWRENTRARLLEEQDYWSFSKRGLDHVCPHRTDPHRPKDSSTGPPGGAPVATTNSHRSG
jgi:hypothetical protein